ncbi:longitudinals lacking protein isoform X1 [Nilaparvata lugens]|uniref:longitudinals lacking protein isoform X1 n=1 Tax=Nilaparvata lugens TaxID=108931 RepID=UPI00193D61AF|nr:longitudinals lacking protein isoform X1 [Nilaparvata lugens]
MIFAKKSTNFIERLEMDLIKMWGFQLMHFAFKNINLLSRVNVECFKCKQCGKSYRHRSSLNKHVKNECGKDPQMQCPYCSHRTKHKGNLKSHIVAKHLTNF